MSDTETFTFHLWNIAPDRWVGTPDVEDSFEVVQVEMVEEGGSERLVVTIERVMHGRRT